MAAKRKAATAAKKAPAKKGAKRAAKAAEPEPATHHVGELPIAAAERAPAAPAVRVVETDPQHPPAEVLHEEPEAPADGDEEPAHAAAEEGDPEEAPPIEGAAPAKDQLADVMAHLVF